MKTYGCGPICSAPGSRASCGRPRVPSSSSWPKVDLAETPPSLVLPSLPISTTQKQYSESTTAMTYGAMNYGVGTLVIVEQRPRFLWGPDNNGLAINGGDTVGKRPPVLEALCNSSPVICGGHWQKLLHKGIPNHPAPCTVLTPTR